MGGAKVVYTLSIPSGGTISNELSFNQVRFGAEAVIHVPDTISGAVEVESTAVREPGAGDWRTLTQEDGTAVPVTAGEAVPIPALGAGLRLVTSIAPGADEVYKVVIGEK